MTLIAIPVMLLVAYLLTVVVAWCFGKYVADDNAPTEECRKWYDVFKDLLKMETANKHIDLLKKTIIELIELGDEEELYHYQNAIMDELLAIAKYNSLKHKSSEQVQTDLIGAIELSLLNKLESINNHSDELLANEIKILKSTHG